MDDDFSISAFPEPGSAITWFARRPVRSRTRSSFYTLTTTAGRQAVIPVPRGCDRWLIAVRYVNMYCPRDDFLADVQPATRQGVDSSRAEHPNDDLEWLSSDLWESEPDFGWPAHLGGRSGWR